MDKIDLFLNGLKVLPPAPQVLPKLLNALNDPASDVSDVADLIAFDPSLTAKLLQTCNSAYYGLSAPVNDVNEAVNRLGMQVVSRIVTVVSGSGSLKLPAESGLDANVFWHHSVVTAFAGQFVGEDAGTDPGLLFTAGLLHDIGKVVLAQAFAKDYGALLSTGGQADMQALERAAFRFDHAEIGGKLLDRWKLSTPLVEAVKHHHNPKGATEFQKIAACVSLADALAHATDQPESDQRKPINALPDSLSLLKLTTDDLERHRDLILENWRFVEGLCKLQS